VGVMVLGRLTQDPEKTYTVCLWVCSHEHAGAEGLPGFSGLFSPLSLITFTPSLQYSGSPTWEGSTSLGIGL
jgi:hypothetical protein